MEKSTNILDPISDTLSPLIWNHPEASEPTLKPQVAEFIKRTIYRALDSHGYRRPERWLSLYLTGSLTTYQFSEQSDCDTSLFVNSEIFPGWARAEMIGLMISHVDGTVIPGTPFPLQAYVVAKHLSPADLYRPDLRSGYSIDENRWISAPSHSRAHNPEEQENGYYVYALEQADKMRHLLEYEPHKAIQFWHQIHARRMRDQKAGKGDYAESNLVYKFLERKGLFPQLAELSGEHIAQTGHPVALAA